MTLLSRWGRGSGYRVASSGEMVCLGSGTELLSIALDTLMAFGTPPDHSNPRLHELSLGAMVTDVCMDSQYAYVGVGDAGIRICEVRRDRNPVMVGTYAANLYADAVALAGDFLFVSWGDSGLYVLDVSDAASPQLVGRYVLKDSYDVAVDSGIAYLHSSLGIEVLDVSDPRKPTRISRIEWEGTINHVTARDRFLYCTSNASLVVIDVRNPAQPVGRSALQFADPLGVVAVEGDLALVALTVHGFYIVDIANPDQPVVLETLSGRGTTHDFAFNGQFCFASQDFRVLMLDISQANSAIEVTRVDLPGPTNSTARNGDYVFLGASNGLRVIDIRDPLTPREVAYNHTPEANDEITMVRNLIYTASGVAGMRIIDVTTPTDPQEISSYVPGFYCSAIDVSGQYAYVCSGTLKIVDISDTTHPVKVGERSWNNDRSMDVEVQDTVAYVAWASSGMVILDVSIRSSPAVVSVVPVPPGVISRGIAVHGCYAYLATLLSGRSTEGWLYIVDVSDPLRPAVRSITHTDEGLGAVSVVDSLAYVGGVNGSVFVFNADDPANPVLVTTVRIPDAGGIAAPSAEGNLIVVAEGYAGLGVYRREVPTVVPKAPIGTPEGFVLFPCYPNPFNPSTTIRYALPIRSHVSLAIFNTLGQQMATLVEGEQDAGHHAVQFDASNLSCGVYLYRLLAGGFIDTRKLVVVR